ncbi:MAG TPA: ADOP family duplicated permease [Candidatus Acidoferrales bacterium]|nr:ADOP family duplicated permease [Candidatus Acidoferrales bacterium]
MIRGRLHSWMTTLFHRSRLERDMDAELRSHIETYADDLMHTGIPREEALRRARLEFGGIERVKEECRESRGIAFIESLLQDLSYGFRMLAKNWKSAAIAAFSLAVAMALSVAGLSVFNAVMLRPPMAAAPDRLVTIYSAAPTSDSHNISYADYEYYRDESRSFSGVAAFREEISMVPMTVGGQADTGTIETASDNYFSVMGMRRFLGQLFTPGANNQRSLEAVLTYSCWQRLGADPNIVGKSVVFGSQGQPRTIVGVAPKGFTGIIFGFGADVIINLAGNNAQLVLMARLKRGVTLQRARAELRTLSAQLAAAHPKNDKGRVAVLTPATAFSSDPGAHSTAELISAVLIAIVLMVLLIACANVANLLLGLATGRKQEMLIRAALGATRRRLVRQLLTESAILCAAGGIAGFILASIALAQFSQFRAATPFGTFDLAANLRTNGTVLAMALGLILIATLASGLTPAIYSSATNIAGALSGEGVIGGTRKSVIRNALVVIQIAVCTLVMVGVGLCLRSLHNLESVNLGFSARNLASVPIDLHSNGISEPDGLNLYRELRQSAARLPGVQSSSLAAELPLIDSNWPTDGVRIGSTGSSSKWTQIPTNIVDANYFSTLGIPLVAGRTFDFADTKDAPEVAVISQNMAKTYWPDSNPIGKQIRVQSGNRMVTVVGVVGDTKYNSLDESAHPVVYYALSQHYLPELLLTVRTAGNPGLWTHSLSEMIRGLGLKFEMQPFTWNDVMYFALLIPVLTFRVVSFLCAFAMLLAILGLYGAIFYSVNERRKEIGIRVALGAQPAHLLKLFLYEAAVISGVGVSIGLALGVAATILFRSQFFGIRNVDLHILAPVGLAMVFISMASAYLAARPWIKVSPMEAVRHA